jgi:hypothetical protein
MKYKINLLAKKKESIVDRIIYFSLNYLRYILVITQIFVIFVFFYRFKVDQEIIDLKDAVAQKKEIVNISQSLLKDAAAMEVKINQIKPILQKQNYVLDELNYILSIFPESISVSKMSINDKEMALDCSTDNSTIIKIFYQRLLKEKKFKQINLVNLKKNETDYTFSLILSEYVR